MRDLEEMGFCNEVEVEIVPLSKVPPKIVKEIFNVHRKNSSEKRVGRRTNRLIENRTQNDDDDVRGESDKNGGGGDGDELNDDHQERNDRFRIKTETKKINPNESDRKSTIIETKQISSSISSKPTTTSTTTTTTTTTKTSINMQTVSKIGTVSFLGNYGQLNTYLSDEQMKATRLTNTIVVMAPCLRQPITTSSTISSDNNSSSSSSSVSSSSPLSSAMIDTIDGLKKSNLHHQHHHENGRCHYHHHQHHLNQDVHTGRVSVKNLSPNSQTRLDQHSEPSFKSFWPHCSHHHCHQKNQHNQHNFSSLMNHKKHFNVRQRASNIENRKIKVLDLEKNYQIETKRNSGSEENREEIFQKDNCEDGIDEEEDDDDDEDDDGEEEEEEEEEGEEREECENRDGKDQIINGDLFSCNVCGRSFKRARSMACHQVYKRHFGCSICDIIFPTLKSLELHKQTLDHWSDDDDDDDEDDNVDKDDEEEDPDDEDYSSEADDDSDDEEADGGDDDDDDGDKNSQNKREKENDTKMFSNPKKIVTGKQQFETIKIDHLYSKVIEKPSKKDNGLIYFGGFFGSPKPSSISSPSSSSSPSSQSPSNSMQQHKHTRQNRQNDDSSGLVSLLVKSASWINRGGSNGISKSIDHHQLSNTSKSNCYEMNALRSKPIFTTSLSNKLMASVFDFSSSTISFEDRHPSPDFPSQSVWNRFNFDESQSVI
ncbi:hypothetical protein SSS_02667 [Sarcoptes scabiei]|uniref:C2H2-type domain-containing protein n=1 Tax=Sarcoptes scabiei TaxID=52283 RepID=A0A834RB13_SARSC|nr:hypothetical protein SSS_02667 [Sarcoptes scabiei]